MNTAGQAHFLQASKQMSARSSSPMILRQTGFGDRHMKKTGNGSAQQKQAQPCLRHPVLSYSTANPASDLRLAVTLSQTLAQRRLHGSFLLSCPSREDNTIFDHPACAGVFLAY
eukprot:3654741-Rhodomonas_salina.1